MIEQLETNKEHDILGYTLKVHPEEDEKAKVPSHRVIDFVQQNVEEMKGKFPHLDNAQIAVLLAMNFAREKLEMEQNYREDIETIEMTANRALQLVESITPKYN